MSRVVGVRVLAGALEAGFADGNHPSQTRFNLPQSLFQPNNETLLIADRSNGCIRRFNIETGELTTAVGSRHAPTQLSSSRSIPALKAHLNSPSCVCSDPSSSDAFFISCDGDESDSQIQKCILRVSDDDGLVSIVAGHVSPDSSADGSSNSRIRFNDLSCILAIPSQRSLFPEPTVLVSNMSEGSIQAISLNQGASQALIDPSFLISNHLCDAFGMALDSRNRLLFTCMEAHVVMSYDFASKQCSCVAGQPGQLGLVDGNALTEARFGDLAGICVDPVGNIYVCDSGHGALRVISPRGLVHTIVCDSANFHRLIQVDLNPTFMTEDLPHVANHDHSEPTTSISSNLPSKLFERRRSSFSSSDPALQIAKWERILGVTRAEMEQFDSNLKARKLMGSTGEIGDSNSHDEKSAEIKRVSQDDWVTSPIFQPISASSHLESQPSPAKFSLGRRATLQPIMRAPATQSGSAFDGQQLVEEVPIQVSPEKEESKVALDSDANIGVRSSLIQPSVSRQDSLTKKSQPSSSHPGSPPKSPYAPDYPSKIERVLGATVDEIEYFRRHPKLLQTMGDITHSRSNPHSRSSSPRAPVSPRDRWPSKVERVLGASLAEIEYFSKHPKIFSTLGDVIRHDEEKSAGQGHLSIPTHVALSRIGSHQPMVSRPPSMAHPPRTPRSSIAVPIDAHRPENRTADLMQSSESSQSLSDGDDEKALKKKLFLRLQQMQHKFASLYEEFTTLHQDFVNLHQEFDEWDVESSPK